MMLWMRHHARNRPPYIHYLVTSTSIWFNTLSWPTILPGITSTLSLALYLQEYSVSGMTHSHFTPPDMLLQRYALLSPTVSP
jgi:hypothetical protein